MYSPATPYKLSFFTILYAEEAIYPYVYILLVRLFLLTSVSVLLVLYKFNKFS